MNLVRTALTAALAVSLGGCFISETPLVGAGEAAFPFESIAYKEANSDEPTTMVREGDAYVIAAPDGDVRVELRFRDIGDGLYLTQASGKDRDGKTSILYTVLKVDFEKRTAESYKAVARTEEARDGLRPCDDGMLCIDDLDAYLALAREAVASGKPDVTYTIVATE